VSERQAASLSGVECPAPTGGLRGRRSANWRHPRRAAASLYLDGYDAFIFGLIKQRKDITLNEMVERLVAAQSVRNSHSTCRSASSAWLGSHS
jgi:hypothetical protein